MDIQKKCQSEIVLKRRQAIFALQESMQRDDIALPVETFPVRHFFAPGQYAREITIPAGKVIVGKIHRCSHVNTLSYGEVVLYTEKDGAQHCAAPFTYVSDVGTKRVILAITDAVWTTYHVTQSTDLEQIESEMISETFEDLK